MKTIEQKKETAKLWRSRNKEQLRIMEAARDRNPKRRERKKICDRKRKFGISQEMYESFLISQSGACAICKTNSPSGNGGWHVDHCHATGIIRGLLCHQCNVGLGHFKDNAQILIGAANYLLSTSGA